jgi:hypothetical protein
VNFHSFSGIINAINNFDIQNGGCNLFVTVNDQNGKTVNFVVTPDTYFTNRQMIRTGDFVTVYYDGNAPAILIYPPQYPALILVKYNPNQNIKVDYFDNELISSDGQLKLNISPLTRVMLKNGLIFGGNPANRNLIVFYKSSTRSIPARTTPEKIVVWCG